MADRTDKVVFAGLLYLETYLKENEHGTMFEQLTALTLSSSLSFCSIQRSSSSKSSSFS